MNYIKEIAELLECGHQCYFHVKNKTIEYHPDMDDFMDDMEPWQDVIEKIEADFDEYIKISKMDSNHSYRVMERFAELVDSDQFRGILENSLNRPKPFRNFKNLIDQSEYLQEWFDFRLNANMEWVKEQIAENK